MKRRTSRRLTDAPLRRSATSTDTTRKRGPPRPRYTLVDLGIAGWRVPLHSHIACLWETEQDFAEAVGFLEAGLKGSDHCVVIGNRADNERILAILESRGLDVDALQTRGRLTVLERAPTAQAMLDDIAAALDRALTEGATLVRLSGNVAWDRKAGPRDAELLSYEAQLTKIAQEYPCVVLCLHPVHALTGLIARHGVFRTHPRILEETGVLGNPFFIPFERFRDRLDAVAAVLSKGQDEREASRRLGETLQAIFDNIPVMISFADPSGRPLLVNREWERVLGWSFQEAQGYDFLAEAYPDPESRREVLEFMQKAEQRWQDFRTRTKDGRIIDTSWLRVGLSNGTQIGFGLDLTERKRLQALARESLQSSHDELRLLSERLRTVREEERARIAREVHDEVGQALTALQMDVAWLEKKIATSPETAPESCAAKLKSMAALLDTTLGAVQRIATELRPGVLDELGLDAATEWYVREFESRTGIPCDLRSDLKGALVEPDLATAVFRILQEALTNVVRHSGAGRVEILLSADPNELRLEVRDNGRGIPKDRVAASRSLGLIGMRERALSLGGDLLVRGIPDVGTTVTLRLPR